jgi:hypothetical protein
MGSRGIVCSTTTSQTIYEFWVFGNSSVIYCKRIQHLKFVVDFLSYSVMDASNPKSIPSDLPSKE